MHINHGSHFTSHFEIYSRNEIEESHPYWGKLHPGGTRPVFNGRVRLAIIVSTVRVLQEVEDGPTARADGSGVGATGAAAAPAAGGRPSNDHRPIINGILWILRTGAPWEDLPARSGLWQALDGLVPLLSLARGRRSGTASTTAVKAQADAAGELDWDLHHVDATVIRAHQHAAGAKKGTQRPKRWGAARAASVPKSTSAPRATANR